MPGTSTQTATITWTDPVVGSGQAALATLTVYSSLIAAGSPRVAIGTVNPGVQTFTTAAGQLTNGSSYYFSVQATDVNGQTGPFSANTAAIGPVGAPGTPANIKAVLN